jgi:hypothetical protein
MRQTVLAAREDARPTGYAAPLVAVRKWWLSAKTLDLVWVWFYKNVAPTALEIFAEREQCFVGQLNNLTNENPPGENSWGSAVFGRTHAVWCWALDFVKISTISRGCQN